MLTATGLLLSTALAGCATRGKLALTPPAAIAVDTHVPPSAELLVCPERPEGFPADAAATMPAAVRFATIRLATAYAAVMSQVERLIGWETGTPCPAAGAR